MAILPEEPPIAKTAIAAPPAQASADDRER
jgi:hypothetical protein